MENLEKEIELKKYRDDIHDFIDYVATVDNNLFDELFIILKNYIVYCRVEIGGNIYKIPVNCENIKNILPKYNVFISSMIDVYCKTMMVFKSELFMKSICHCERNINIKESTYSKFLGKVESFKLDLNIFYNKIFNFQIKDIKAIFNKKSMYHRIDSPYKFCQKIFIWRRYN